MNIDIEGAVKAAVKEAIAEAGSTDETKLRKIIREEFESAIMDTAKKQAEGLSKLLRAVA